MPTWDEAAQWYLGMVGDGDRGFNDLAGDTALDLLGDVLGCSVLDVGCGEGHVARRLARRGARVIGVEPTGVLLAAALDEERREPLGISYGGERAEDLTGIVTGSLDAACAVLVLHHVPDLDVALGELHRVLADEGVLVVVIPHPWTDHPGAVWAEEPDGLSLASRVIGDYTREGIWSSGVPAADVSSVRDIGWHHRSVATWMTSLARAGFCLAEVREPVGGLSSRPDGGGHWSGVPRFLALRATRLPTGPTRSRPPGSAASAR